LPLAEMTVRTSPEIHGYLHNHLISWIKFRIFNNHDSELFNGSRAADHLAMFELKFGRRPADQGDIFEGMQVSQFISDSDIYAGDYL
jgi:hypothetical protein